MIWQFGSFLDRIFRSCASLFPSGFGSLLVVIFALWNSIILVGIIKAFCSVINQLKRLFHV